MHVFTSRAKGSLRINRSVDLWYCRISLRALVPGLLRRLVDGCASRPATDRVARALLGVVLLRRRWLVGVRGECLVRTMVGSGWGGWRGCQESWLIGAHAIGVVCLLLLVSTPFVAHRYNMITTRSNMLLLTTHTRWHCVAYAVGAK